MLLGIPFHVAAIYKIGPDWDFAMSNERSEILTLLVEVLHIFRMPLFFVVAGYFSMMSLSRSTPGTWFGGRVVKLGLPLLAVGILLNPISLMAQPDSVWLMSQPGDHWLAHLWFLPTLVLLCACLALMRATPLQAWFARCVDRVATRPLAGTVLFVVVASGLSGVGAMLGSRVPEAFFLNATLPPAVGFLPFMMLGAAMQMDRRLLASMSESSVAAFALTAIPLVFVLSTTWGDSWFNLARFFAMSMVCLGCARALLTFCRLKLGDPNRHVRRIADASFTIYLVHLPLLNVLYMFFRHGDLPVFAEFCSMVVLVAVASYCVHLLIAKSRVLMLVFNGVSYQRSGPPIT